MPPSAGRVIITGLPANSPKTDILSAISVMSSSRSILFHASGKLVRLSRWFCWKIGRLKPVLALAGCCTTEAGCSGLATGTPGGTGCGSLPTGRTGSWPTKLGGFTVTAFEACGCGGTIPGLATGKAGRICEAFGCCQPGFATGWEAGWACGAFGNIQPRFATGWEAGRTGTPGEEGFEGSPALLGAGWNLSFRGRLSKSRSELPSPVPGELAFACMDETAAMGPNSLCHLRPSWLALHRPTAPPAPAARACRV
mmetsp:Transcript_105444/g.335688  ORF Transcript_105444/g.335688 Transcript_105444/m.335688 type:complete len:254 (+) Transcript_105444:1097-1858(+)